MSISLYKASVPVFQVSLRALKDVLAKGAAWSDSRKVDQNVLLQSRLYPDMHPLVRQVQIAADFAKGATARLAGQDPPSYADVETSFAELQARLDKTLDFIGQFMAAQIDGREATTIKLKAGPNELTFVAEPYLLHFALPNFYFHMTTAYAILRHVGVEIGKRDFCGQFPHS